MGEQSTKSERKGIGTYSSNTVDRHSLRTIARTLI